jgi:hypothetical protein
MFRTLDAINAPVVDEAPVAATAAVEADAAAPVAAAEGEEGTEA